MYKKHLYLVVSTEWLKLCHYCVSVDKFILIITDISYTFFQEAVISLDNQCL